MEGFGDFDQVQDNNNAANGGLNFDNGGDDIFAAAGGIPDSSNSNQDIFAAAGGGA